MNQQVLIGFSIVSLAAMAASVLHTAASRGRTQPGTPNAMPSPAAQRELDHAAAAIDAIEASTLAEMRNKWNSSPYERMVKLGRGLLNDKHLSVDNNTACTVCHTEETAFTGTSSVINQTLVAYPGSTRSRHGQRKPQGYGYPFAPALHRDAAGTDFVGGQFLGYARL